MTEQLGLLKSAIDDHLSRLGEGKIASVPYDTAWIARLAKVYPGQNFDEATDWLRRRQHPDGSWGGDVVHYHDRIISTLAALITLRSLGDPKDYVRIRRGEQFLWREHGRLHHDAHDTIAFPVLALSLGNEALAVGLDVPRDLYRDASTIEKKLNLLGDNPHLWRYSTMAFSLEVVSSYTPDELNFLENNGSVGTSPAATAAIIMYCRGETTQPLAYLDGIMAKQGDGGAPNVDPIDTFEIAWSLNMLRLAGAVDVDHPQVRRALAHLWSAWSATNGMCFSSYFSVADLDCTAVAFNVLKWGGYPVDANVFEVYEEDKHFRCYPGEINTSLSAHVRALAALQVVDDHPRLEIWVNKILGTLRRYDLNGYFWFDKWHVSPYYLTCVAVTSLNQFGDELAAQRIHWIIKTQHTDGGWGYYGQSTPEETAYCLQTLLHWDRHVARVDPSQIHEAASYLLANINSDFTPLWIGKCLYTPTHVVRSAIYSALFSYYTHGDSR